MTETVLQELLGTSTEPGTLARDLRAFTPELVICAAIVILLLFRLFRLFDRAHLGWAALLFTVGAFAQSCVEWARFPTYIQGGVSLEAAPEYVNLFGGLLIFDRFSIFVKVFLYGFTALVIVLALLARIPDREDSADFCCLLLGAALGMSIMASANHLLMVFMGIEMASVPSYALAGFLKGRRQSSEAALKYVVYGGGASGVMLYGISLLAGKFGTCYLPDVLLFVQTTPLDPLVTMGLLFILIGVAFKLAAVPFHFWCPDVFEGAAAEIAAFLSVASKGAALALLARIAVGLGGLEKYLIPVLAFFAAVTMTFGNLAAYGQTNLKRLLAYSTIAHAGFMMMGLATLRPSGAGAVLFYLMVYLVMNLGAFAVVAFLRNATGSEDLRDFRGLVQRAPVMVVTLGFFLLSLLGLPPLGGFAAKFQIFSELFEAASDHQKAGQFGLANTLYALLILGGLNTVLSLIYYVKVLKVMVLERPLEEVEGVPVAPVATPPLQNAYASALAVAVLALGIFWNPLAEFSLGQSVGTFDTASTGQHVKGER
jgi:NADH-quinone oxidoreductase subunit N